MNTKEALCCSCTSHRDEMPCIRNGPTKLQKIQKGHLRLIEREQNHLGSDATLNITIASSPDLLK